MAKALYCIGGNQFSEQKMTEVRVEVKTLLKTRKWMLSLNYIPAGF